MIHVFDVEIAKKYGVNAAVLLQNLGFWIKQNEANETNFYDGHYWTYNSRRAYKELFPYMSERQINTAFQKLIDDGLVITGNYNKLAYDRTLWYALTQKGKCILHFDIMENYEMSNGSGQNERPIPDVNTDAIPNENTDKKKEGKKESSYDVIISEYTTNEDLRTAIYDFIKMRKLIKSPLTDRGLNGILSKLNKLAKTDDRKILILEQSIERSWKGVFPLKDEPIKKGNTFDEYGDPEEFYK